MRRLARGLAGLAVVAAVGFLWAHFGLTRTPGPPPPLVRRATIAGLSFRYPALWRPLPTGAGGPLSAELRFSSPEAAGASVTIGVVFGVPAVALPTAVASLVARLPSPELVDLGGLTFRRYLDAALRGARGAASLYLLPTTAGTVTAICASDAVSDYLTAECERVLATVRPPGEPLSLRVDPAYAFALNRILDALNAARRADGPGLESARASTRARAAGALADSTAAAAAAVQRIGGGLPAGDVSAANPALSAALQYAAAAYRRLSVAYGGGDRARQAAAAAAVSAAERSLAGALDELRSLGYGLG
ncbi:MAG TPA: hypothetical protein VKV27_13225 [Solirubrobacteraceae bacterium]|nr:hypothetical protein [Solirubrobacteraceae bacterium]